MVKQEASSAQRNFSQSIEAIKGPSIVVGLDFGTTYSGIAWALAGNPEDIEVVSTWPGGGNRTSPKVPTTITYEDDKFQWGYQTNPHGEVVRGVKLLLDDSQEPNYNPALDSKFLLRKLAKTPVSVSGDYLERLVSHAKEVLERRFGEAMKAMVFDYVLTVPAVWSDKAKDATLRAANVAGIPTADIFLVSEPEAAALYTLRTIQPNTITTADVLIICDAGGGTVDLISYCVKQPEPLQLEEVTEGTGGTCGSMLLDERFERLLKDLLGANVYQSLTPKAKAVAMKYWVEQIKPNYSGSLSEHDYVDLDYQVPLPGSSDNASINLEGGFLQLSRSQIEGIFDPIVRHIERLVESQTKRIVNLGLSTKAIVLVGGFGASEYLFRRLQSANPGVRVMQPPNAWSAIVRGAVHRGLDGNQVQSRKARRHYGVRCNSVYDSSRHNPKDMVWCSLEEMWRAHNQMRWFIQRGDTISEDDPIRIPFYRNMTVKDATNANNMIFKDTLQFCNNTTAPDAFTTDVLPLCIVEADLSKVPKELFTKCCNSQGREYYQIIYNLVMTPTSASIFFELELNGISYGIVRAKY